MDLPVSLDELVICKKVLQSLESNHLKILDKDFVDAGVKLFGRTIRKQLYEQNGDLVDYIKNQTNQTKVLRKLERIHNEIHHVHAENVESSRCTAINEMREARDICINSSQGLHALTTHANIMTLIEANVDNDKDNNDSTKLIEMMIGTLNIKKSNFLTDKSNDDNTENSSNAIDDNDTTNTTNNIISIRNNNNINKDFREGGLGRSRNRKSTFSKDRIRGMYDHIEDDYNDDDDGDDGDKSVIVRKPGKVILIPRKTNELGYLCYVLDDNDNAKRACPKRTVVDLLGVFDGLGIDVSLGKLIEYPCTYVIGMRKQKWALFSGEVEGMSGETAISVRLSNKADLSSSATSTVSNETPIENYTVPPIGSFRKHCNICKQPYDKLHSFYHQLCLRCADFNLEKRFATAQLNGYIAVVTGGRVRIGYQICLRLLRAGATVISTTRWPKDAALRYSNELDFSTWRERLSIEQLELTDILAVENFCKRLYKRYNRIHILINNAAQTITRPSSWIEKMNFIEQETTPLLTDKAFELLSSSVPSKLLTNNKDIDHNDSKNSTNDSIKLATRNKTSAGWILLDECGQPLDLSGSNSWSKRLGEVDTFEMAQTVAVNAMAPFILCSQLLQLMKSTNIENNNDNDEIDDDRFNVTALEGKFNVGKKSGGHPHTNMSKAALNMLTLTAARDYAREGILMNSVDTGWVTDMSPTGIGATASTHETFVGPPLDDEDGSSRVVDPIFSHVNNHVSGSKLQFGNFYKDYYKASW